MALHHTHTYIVQCIYLSIHPSIHLYLYLYIYIYISISVSISISSLNLYLISLSLSISISISIYRYTLTYDPYTYTCDINIYIYINMKQNFTHNIDLYLKTMVFRVLQAHQPRTQVGEGPSRLVAQHRTAAP